MIQEILVCILFFTATVYLGRIVYRQFKSKAACASGCNKCGAVDFQKIEASLKERNF